MLLLMSGSLSDISLNDRRTIDIPIDTTAKDNLPLICDFVCTSAEKKKSFKMDSTARAFQAVACICLAKTNLILIINTRRRKLLSAAHLWQMRQMKIPAMLKRSCYTLVSEAVHQHTGSPTVDKALDCA